MTTSLSRWQRGLRDLAAPFRRPGPRRPRRPLALETLEDRIVPAVDLTFNDFAYVAGLDTAGNLYVYGSVSGTADLDPGPGAHWLAGPAQYVAKYTPQKQLLWAQRTDDVYATYSVVATSSANGQDFVYAMEGATSGSPGIARYQDTGAGLSLLWRNQTGAPGRISVGDDGAAYLSEGFSGTIDLDPADPADPTPLTGDTLTSGGVFLAKWDVNGAFQWVHQLGGAGNVWMSDLAVVNDGVGESVYVGGQFDGTFAPQGYAGSALTNQGATGTLDQDGYLVRYDTGGGFVSVGQFVNAHVRQVSGDASGTYVAGIHYQAALGLPGTQNEDIYFGKLDASGQSLAWVKGLAGPASNGLGDLLVDAGSLLLTGELYSPFGTPMDFDPGAGTSNLTPAGKSDAFVASYSATGGAFQWAQQVGGATWTGTRESGNSLAVFGTNLYLGGSLGQGQATFGPDTLTGYAEQDGFVAGMGRGNGSPLGAFSVGSVVRTMDDGDAGYSESGSGWKNNTDGGFGGDSRYHTKGSGSNVAKWAFTGLLAGTYDVLATWKANSKNATNAPFKVNGTAVTKSQRVAPDDYLSDGYHTFWEPLGTFTVGGDGKLTVSLSDQANGNVVADGVRIILRTPAAALLAAGPASGTARPVTLAATELRPILREAVARWEATGLPPAQAAALRAVNVQVADLGGATLGLASGHTIWLDDNAAGWGWFVDRTPRDDREFAAPGDQGEQGRMDLLTVLMHEMGHALGLDHDAAGVMQESLPAGTRRLPTAAEAGTLALPVRPRTGGSPRAPLGAAHRPLAPSAVGRYFAGRADWDAVAVALSLARDPRRKG
jgi:hypothetical protein